MLSCEAEEKKGICGMSYQHFQGVLSSETLAAESLRGKVPELPLIVKSRKEEPSPTSFLRKLGSYRKATHFKMLATNPLLKR